MSLVGYINGTGIEIIGLVKAGKFFIKAKYHKYGSETAGMLKTGVSDA